MEFDYSDILNSYNKYIEHLIQKTKIPLTIPNIAASGSEVEQEIRLFLRKLMPERFRLTHGHIVFTESRHQCPLISPQIDLLIVDNLVPNSLFRFGTSESPEIVPFQAVVGILEIKRTFSKKSLIDTIRHLDRVAKSINFRRDSAQRYILGGHKLGPNISGGYYGIPMFGAISLDHEENIEGNLWKIINETGLQEIAKNIDLIFSLSGFTASTIDKSKGVVDIFPVRGNAVEFCELAVSNKSKKIAFALGFLIAYLLSTSGRIMSPLDYLFNEPPPT